MRVPLVCSAVLLGGLLAGPGMAAGQVIGYGSSPGATSANETYALDGVVVNAVTGAPIPRALVQGPGGAQLTGADGKFHFEKLPPGTYNLMARKPGYFNEQELSPGTSRFEPLQVGPNMQPLVLKLMPEGVIYGRITAPNGEPLEGVPVRVYAQRISNGRKQWEVHGGSTSDEDGAFRFAGLRSGKYYLRAGPGTQPVARVTGDGQKKREGYASVFYPEARDRDSATAIPLDAGQEYRTDFTVPRVLFYEVTGTVTGQTSGVNGVAIQPLTGEGDGLPFGANFDPATGQFVLAAVPEGSYVLYARALDTVTRQQLTARVPLEVHGDVAGIHLTLQPELKIPVNVRTETTRPTQATTFQSTNSRPPVNVTLAAEDAGMMTPRVGMGAEGQPGNQTWSLRNVQPGKYRLEITAFGPWYVESARSGEVDLLREDLVVGFGAAVEPIEVVLRDDAASLRGTVASGGQPAAGVVLIASGDTRGMTRLAFTQPDGTFYVSNLAPGDYRALALDSVRDLEYAEPDALREFSGAMQTVRLAPNQQGSVSLELQRRQK